jgi:outer membrane protein assembly factor BamB
VFFGSSGGTLYALNAETGEELWNKSQKGFEFYTAAPLIADNVVYFSSTEYSRAQNVRPNGRIFALDLKTGKELWVYNTRTTLGAAAYANKTIVVDDSGSQLHAVDAATGQKLWNFKASGDGVWQPAIKNGTVYFSTNDGSLHAVDLQTGRERWKTAKEPKVATLLALDETHIYFGGENLNLFAVDQANGKIKWVYKTKKQCKSLVVGAGIVSFMTEGVMLALDTNTGGEKWKVDGLNKVVSAPIFAPEAIYFLDGEGHLYSLK